MKLQFTGPADDVIKKIEKAVNKFNGTFNGDEKSGDIKINIFGNNISGHYEIDGSSINVDILEKPIFVSESMIKNEIEKWL